MLTFPPNPPQPSSTPVFCQTATEFRAQSFLAPRLAFPAGYQRRGWHSPPPSFPPTLSMFCLCLEQRRALAGCWEGVRVRKSGVERIFFNVTPEIGEGRGEGEGPSRFVHFLTPKLAPLPTHPLFPPPFFFFLLEICLSGLPEGRHSSLWFCSVLLLFGTNPLHHWLPFLLLLPPVPLAADGVCV